VNRPCVVLGRFQNPWLECHLPYLVQNDIWIVRRQSGGGCVFHDEGNLNYSFIYPESLINRHKGVELIQKAFSRYDIPLEISSRHDLWMDGKKISGSAFKQTKQGSFHHGTFLISSDMKKLEDSLKHTIIPQETKSIPSVRSKVISLQEKLPKFKIQDMIDLVASELKTTQFNIDSEILSQHLVQESFRKLTSWDWLWGETPHFEYLNFSIHKGLIKAPFKGRFDKSLLQDFLSREEISKLFPDFSYQYQSQGQIF
jgi:lipoate-protein ligase A